MLPTGKHTFPPPVQHESHTTNEEETKGLLADEEQSEGFDVETTPSPSPLWQRRGFIWASTFVAILLAGAFTRILLLSPPRPANSNSQDLFTGHDTRSNGTHQFKRTVLIVSIDGLRADYLDRGLTPHLLDISKKGLRAKSMMPIFPTLTFPNHWALMTGLHAESHGIVANNFWDPVSKKSFVYNKIESCSIPSWWYGEPMWETAGKAGMITANLMWPGPPKTTSGASATYFKPWRNKVPLQEKLEQIMKWIDLPLSERPQLITAYEPSLDQAGHRTGPMSALVNKTLEEVDRFAKDLHTALVARNLTHIVDIVFVSDHGMTDTSHMETIYLDDFLDVNIMQEVEHIDGWPSMGLRFSPTANLSAITHQLERAALNREHQFHVYTKDTMPERYHFSKSERIAPLYLVPQIGYYLSTKRQGTDGNLGNHGFDNQENAMQAMFVAHGPFSTGAKIQHQQRSQSLGLIARYLSNENNKNKGWHSTSDDTYVMDRFQNVEIYNLVIKLLGIEEHAAPTNGTTHFWDKYF